MIELMLRRFIPTSRKIAFTSERVKLVELVFIFFIYLLIANLMAKYIILLTYDL